jgi:hypothetical protein
LQTEWAGWIEWAAPALALAPVAVAGIGWLFQRAGLRRDVRRYPPAGLLLSRGDRYLHVVQQGDGRPAVIFEAGLAASSLSWVRVQPLVASFASSISYDRAGLGWSSPRTVVCRAVPAAYIVPPPPRGWRAILESRPRAADAVRNRIRTLCHYCAVSIKRNKSAVLVAPVGWDRRHIARLK